LSLPAAVYSFLARYAPCETPRLSCLPPARNSLAPWKNK